MSKTFALLGKRLKYIIERLEKSGLQVLVSRITERISKIVYNAQANKRIKWNNKIIKKKVRKKRNMDID